ncbi:MAG: RNA polymerase [Thermoplasmata archaeon]|nr:RNA polymerase [Thermoplasmata archaeon]
MSEGNGEERYLTLAEVKEILEEENETRGGLTHEQGFALQHAREIARIPGKRARSLVDELVKIEGVSEETAVTLVDIKAEHPDDVRAVFYRERFEITPETIQQILETMEKYL